MGFVYAISDRGDIAVYTLRDRECIRGNIHGILLIFKIISRNKNNRLLDKSQ